MDKIAFVVPPSELHDGTVETLWAARVGDGLYRLDNSPFYAYGVSSCDIVRAISTERGLEFLAVEKSGGHSTYRVILLDEAGELARLNLGTLREWSGLQEFGCTFEGLGSWLYSIDVPPDADVLEVYRLLQAGEAAGRWTFEEAHYGHQVR